LRYRKQLAGATNAGDTRKFHVADVLAAKLPG
jgi:hypothetical protein